MTSSPAQTQLGHLQHLVGDPMPFNWNALTLAAKLECSGSPCNDFEANTAWRCAWELAGEIKVQWENEVGRDVRAVLDCKAHRRRLEDLDNAPLTRMLMLAKAPDKRHAFPFVVFEHPDESYLDFVVALFRKQSQLKRYGIQFTGQVREIELLMESQPLPSRSRDREAEVENEEHGDRRSSASSDIRSDVPRSAPLERHHVPRISHIPYQVSTESEIPTAPLGRRAPLDHSAMHEDLQTFYNRQQVIHRYSDNLDPERFSNPTALFPRHIRQPLTSRHEVRHSSVPGRASGQGRATQDRSSLDAGSQSATFSEIFESMRPQIEKRERVAPGSNQGLQFARGFDAAMVRLLVRDEILPMCLRVTPSDGDSRSGSEATVGGMLLIRDSLVGLTVAHTFIRAENDRHATQSAQVELVPGCDVTRDRHAILSRFDAQTQSSEGGFSSTALDWALISVVEKGARNLLATTPGSSHGIQKVAGEDFPAAVSVKIHGGKSGRRVGELQTSSSFMTFSWASKSVRVWTVSLQRSTSGRISLLRKGDCGSWVVSPDGQTLYGVVIAQVADRGHVLIIPASDLLRNIQQSLKLEPGDPMLPAVRATIASSPQLAEYSTSEKHLVTSEGPRHTRHPTEQARTSLSAQQESFLVLSPLRDIHRWRAFVKANPDFFYTKNEGLVYLTEAKNALAVNNTPRFRLCIEKVVIFTLVGGKNHRDQRDIFENIYDQKKTTMEEYRKLMMRTRDYCEQQLAIEHAGRYPNIQQSSRLNEETSLVTSALSKPSTSPVVDEHGGSGGGRQSGECGYQPTAAEYDARGDRHKADTPRPQHAQTPNNAINVSDGDIDSQKSASFTGEREIGRIIEWIDKRYIRRDPKRAGAFFRVGRVFAIITHNEHGGANDAETTTKWMVKVGGRIIFSHPNRFAVVRTAHGFCWAVPIHTYGGRGTNMPGLSKECIEAHAVIYDSERKPQILPGEKLSKSPIAVDRSSDADPLVPESRIKFEKVRTIEHNVRAMAIGKISEDSLPRFERYWRRHLLGE